SVVANLFITNDLRLSATNLIVLRQGDGVETIFTRGDSIFLDQLTPSGNYVNTVTIPDSGPSALIQDGTAAQAGYLNLTLDKRQLVLVGFNTSWPYTSGLGGSASAAVPRGIATVNSRAAYNL